MELRIARGDGQVAAGGAAQSQLVLVCRRAGRVGSVSDTTGKQRTLPSERGDRRLTPEDRAALQALTEGDELQELLDEVGKRYPDLSNR